MCDYFQSYFYLPLVSVFSLDILLSGLCLGVLWVVCGGSSPSSSSHPTQPIWLLSSLWRGWCLLSKAQRISPSKQRSHMELLTQAQQRSSLGWVQGAKGDFDCTPLLNNALKKHWDRVFERSLTGMVENKWAWPGGRLQPCTKQAPFQASFKIAPNSACLTLKCSLNSCDMNAKCMHQWCSVPPSGGGAVSRKQR